MAEASYPADLLYHSDHDWARIDESDPSTATLGITWDTLSWAADDLFPLEDGGAP